MEECNTKLTDTSGNEMMVTGSSTVWIRPSKVDDEPNMDGDFYNIEVVVNG